MGGCELASVSPYLAPPARLATGVSMSKTPEPRRHGAHLKPIGSQTPEPRTNPGGRLEASMESPLSLTTRARKKLGAKDLLADKSATYSGEIDSMGSWEWMDDSERQRMSTIQAKEHRKYIQHAQRELYRQREMVPLHTTAACARACARTLAQ